MINDIGMTALITANRTGYSILMNQMQNTWWIKSCVRYMMLLRRMTGRDIRWRWACLLSYHKHFLNNLKPLKWSRQEYRIIRAFVNNHIKSLDYVHMEWEYWSTMQKIKHYSGHENKVNENKVLSYCKALRCETIKNNKKAAFLNVELTNLLSF